jgi:TPR repeat protein
MEWFRRSAEHNDSIGALNLGNLYFHGIGVPPDYTKAAKWFALAAEQGNRAAQANLADLYQLGSGLPRDFNRAYFWRLLSLGTGSPDEDEKLRNLARQLSRDDISQADRRAAEWREAHRAPTAESGFSPTPLSADVEGFSVGLTREDGLPTGPGH